MAPRISAPHGETPASRAPARFAPDRSGTEPGVAVEPSQAIACDDDTSPRATAVAPPARKSPSATPSTMAGPGSLRRRRPADAGWATEASMPSTCRLRGRQGCGRSRGVTIRSAVSPAALNGFLARASGTSRRYRPGSAGSVTLTQLPGEQSSCEERRRRGWSGAQHWPLTCEAARGFADRATLMHRAVRQGSDTRKRSPGAPCRVAGTGSDRTVKVSRRLDAPVWPPRAPGARLAWTLDRIDRAVKPKLAR
jgi:hypothetical protein